jgi:hypothetical protein
LQSGFHLNSFTETAVLRVVSGTLQAVDRGDLIALVFLDLSASSDVVGYEVLLQRLGVTFDFHQLFRSYLLG